MTTLDYHASPGSSAPDATSPTVFVLLFLPFIVAGLTAFSAIHWLYEPFMRLDAYDIAVFAGIPCLNLSSTFLWCRLARRQKLPGYSYLPVLAWFAWMSYLSIGLLIPYLDEPWNH